MVTVGLVVVGLVAVFAAGCSGGGGVEVAPSLTREDLPGVAEPVEVVGVELCGLVDAAGLGFGAVEDGGGGACQWRAADGRNLLVGPSDADPLLNVVGVGMAQVRLVEVDGFPTAYSAQTGRALCDVYMKTAADQGVFLAYGVAEPTSDDLCATALEVAGQVAGGLRR